MHDRNKIANERQENNCDIRIDRDICTFFLMYGNFRVGCTPPRPHPLNPPVGVIVSTLCRHVRRHMIRTEELRRQTRYKKNFSFSLSLVDPGQLHTHRLKEGVTEKSQI